MSTFLGTERNGTGLYDRLCQIAFKLENGPAVSGIFNPGKPISIDAMVVHQITEKMVADKTPFKESDEYNQPQELVSNINNVIFAHNTNFDMQMLEALFSRLNSKLSVFMQQADSGPPKRTRPPQQRPCPKGREAMKSK